MLTTRDLLAAVKTAQSIPSNYRLARLLDVPEGTVQRWNTGRNLPDDLMAARLAELAGLDVAEVVASIHAERAAEGPARDLWKSIAERLHAAGAPALAVILSVLFLGGLHEDSRAATRGYVASEGAAKAVDRLYIGACLARVWRQARHLLAGFIGSALRPMTGPCFT